MDQYIFGMTSPITRRSPGLYPVVMQRMHIADSMGRSLERLGLERRVQDADSVDAILARMRTPRERDDHVFKGTESHSPRGNHSCNR